MCCITSFSTASATSQLNNHQLKLVGLSYGLKSGYGSKTRLVLRSKIIVSFGLKMMFQVILDHLIRDLSGCYTEIPSRPKMPTPIPLLQHREFLEQLARRPSFDPPHNFTRRHRRWRRHKKVDVVFAHHAAQYPYLKRFTCLSYQLPHFQGNIAF